MVQSFWSDIITDGDCEGIHLPSLINAVAALYTPQGFSYMSQRVV